MTVSLSDEELLAELGVEVSVAPTRTYTPQEARLIAGFEDILRFYEKHSRAPMHGEKRDIFERIYAVRLDRLRANGEALELLSLMDDPGLLKGVTEKEVTALDDEKLLESLGAAPSDKDITTLRNVSPVAHRRAAEEVAGREVCRDFETYKPIFAGVKHDLEIGLRETRRAAKKDDVEVGNVFIVNGQMAYVAEKEREFKAPNGAFDARLRVVFDNGTESDLLLRSLQRALLKDDRGRTITSPSAGPLFGDESDNETGTIYVLKSQSDHPSVAPYKDAILKVGVTNGRVADRISGAKRDATYLYGPVEIVDEYTLYDINRRKLEAMLHHLFKDAQFPVEIPDVTGKPVRPREWFFVTAAAVSKAVELIKAQKIQDYVYNRETASFEKLSIEKH